MRRCRPACGASSSRTWRNSRPRRCSTSRSAPCCATPRKQPRPESSARPHGRRCGTFSIRSRRWKWCLRSRGTTASCASCCRWRSSTRAGSNGCDGRDRHLTLKIHHGANAMEDAGRVIKDGEILIEKDFVIPLMDGHILSCNVFRPNRPGKFAPIIAFTPYGKDSDVAVDFKRYWDFVLRDHPDVVQGDSSGKYLTWEVPDPERWIPKGYAIVVVDSRGTGKSPGYYELMSALQTRDVYDVIEWAGGAPWADGKVGMLGVSYLAIKQWQLAALHPPHLAAMIPWEGMFDHYRDFFRHGGIYSSFFMRLLWDPQTAVNQNGHAATQYRGRFTGGRSTGAAL